MPIANGQALTFRTVGLSDAVDATSAFPGAMQQLKDLIPNTTTRGQYVPRPASTQLTNFAGFTGPLGGEALLVVGSRAYGMLASTRFAGKSEPFCYDISAGAFVTIAGATAANTPTTQATSGDWLPPAMTMVGGKIMIAHAGYDGVTHFVGWIDVRGFSIATITGTTHTSTLIDALSASPILAGVQVGDVVSGAGVVAGSTVVSMTATSVILSVATTAGAAGVALTFTSGTKAAPVYNSGQTNTTPLLGVPISLGQFNGRVHYCVNNTTQFSDPLNPLSITLASQSITYGDDTPVTSATGMPLGSQLVGGVAQSLIVMKGDGPYWQVTGDTATSDLRSNAVNGSVGTVATNTITPTTRGLMIVASDGVRLVTLDGSTSDPIGINGTGVNVPFRYAINPTRMAAAFDKNIYRVTVQNGYKDGQPSEEYWLDFGLNSFSGPHSFPAALIAPYRVSGANSFIMFATGINAKLWSSKTQPSAASTYTENSVAMSWVWQPTLLPDNEQMAANQVVESVLGLVLPASQSMNILAMDEQGNTLNNIALSGSGMTGAIWNSFTWGVGVWGGTVVPYQEYRLSWTAPLVFKQITIRITGASQSGFSIGNLYARYQILGYTGGHTP